jgi:hypothetical protein
MTLVFLGDKGDKGLMGPTGPPGVTGSQASILDFKISTCKQCNISGLAVESQVQKFKSSYSEAGVTVE